ncbi:MAG: hypothetical protein HOB64_16645 [Rhodospirillaceae bacterium]|nr:hypothetical protein [Rhodospirillaceae bacterium]MBT5181184.1 hypothetical protein [Rhodospirillaceae bacterium]
MNIPGIEFVDGLFSVTAIILAAVGLFLVFLDLGQTADAGGGLRAALRKGWAGLADTGWRLLPGLVARQLAVRSDAFIEHWFGQSEDNMLASNVFMAMTLVVIPLAALVNMLRGGSAFLFLVVLAIFAAYVLLMILGEMRRAQKLTAFISVAIFAAVFFFVPGYVFTSLTGRLLNMPIGHAVLGSILAAPLLYFVCQSAVLAARLGARRLQAGPLKSVLDRQFAVFAASLPFVYLATYGAFLAGHLAVADLPMHSNWRMMLASFLATGLAAAITLEAARPHAGRLATAGRLLIGLLIIAVLALGLGPLGGAFPGASANLELAWQVLFGFDPRIGGPALGPLFWLVHLPFLPPLLLALLYFGAGIAKLVALFGGPSRPYMMSGIALALMGAAAAAVASFI